MKRQTRREFGQVTFLGFGSYITLGWGLGCKRDGTTTAVAPDSGGGAGLVQLGGAKLLSFTPEEFLTASAAADRILPRDEEPGAVDLGVPYYMDRQLADPDLDEWKKAFMGGLRVLNRQAKKQHNKLFHELPTEEQDQMLARWQAGASGEQRFFAVLMNLTFEGAFGDPTHGGNKDGAGFRMVGFEPGPPRPGLMDHSAGHAHHKGG